MHANRQRYPVSRMSRVLGVARSGYYAWHRRGPSRRSQADEGLFKKIKDIFESSRKTYGSPRIHAELGAQGERVGRKRVARLMRLNGLQAHTKRRRGQGTNSRHGLPRAPNLVQRRFSVERPNAIWLADITYIPTEEGWLYLAGVLDLFSRRIVGWGMDRHPTSSLAQSAVRMALKRRRPVQKLIHHSDQGVQYASSDFQDLLQAHTISPSMSAVGNCFDNAPMESFFGTLKTELVHRSHYPTRAAARRSIFEYVEVFYNRQRRHTALDYLSPENYEIRYLSLLNSVSIDSG